MTDNVAVDDRLSDGAISEDFESVVPSPSNWSPDNMERYLRQVCDTMQALAIRHRGLAQECRNMVK
jgi:hypothetical protein